MPQNHLRHPVDTTKPCTDQGESREVRLRVFNDLGPPPRRQAAELELEYDSR